MISPSDTVFLNVTSFASVMVNSVPPSPIVTVLFNLIPPAVPLEWVPPINITSPPLPAPGEPPPGL